MTFIPKGLVMEFCGGGTLGSVLYSKKEILSTSDILHFASEIASGMAYLHSRGVLHRDLKVRLLTSPPFDTLFSIARVQ
jgi:serine/threonine protein kinase